MPITRREVVVCTLAAVACRVIAVWSLFRWNVPGWGGEMGCIAASLVTGHGFGSPFGVATDTGPTAIVAPLYPVFEAIIFRFLGILSFPAEFLLVTTNVMVSALTTIPLARLAGRLAPQAGVRIAIWTWALLPLTGYTSAAHVWDTAMLTCSVVITVDWLLVIGTRSRSWVWLGVWCGASALLDPAALIPTFAALVVAARRNFLKPLITIAMVALVTSPWIIRNSITFGHLEYLRDNAPSELLYATRDFRPPTRLSPNRNPAELVRYRALGEAAYMKISGEQAESVIRANPTAFARRAAHGWVDFWFGSQEVTTLGWRYGRYALPKRALYAGLTVMTILGFVRLGAASRQTALTLAVFFVVYSLPYALVLVEVRYRSPLEPLLLLMTAVAMTGPSLDRLEVEVRNKPLGPAALQPANV